MNELTVFNNAEFGEVRTVVKNGEPWFVASDIAKALGYRMASDMTRRIDEEDKGYTKVRTLGGEQNMNIINESGLYVAIFGSSLEDAKKFRRWVTSEVLPQIRKTGGYKLPQTYTEALEHLLVTAKENEQLKLVNEEMKPKALFADAVSSSKTSILIGDMAKLLRQNGIDIGQNRLFDYLRDNGYLIKNGNSRNMPTQKSMDLGLFEIKENNIVNPDGSVRITRTTKVTGKGQIYFINHFLKIA